VQGGYAHILIVVTSAFSSYSGCRQYLEDIEAAIACMDPATSLEVDKIRPFYNSSGFIRSIRSNLRQTIGTFNEDEDVEIFFTAHRLPLSMANNCEYVNQLREACSFVMEQFENNP
jgi:protoporphyrin/coproporphyrin ferrochelatase